MNDDTNADLEQRLRDGLRKSALPTAPDALRQRLARLPSEPHSSRLASVFGGLRLAALASAAAVAIAFVLVVRALPGSSGPGPGASFAGGGPASATGSTAPTPTAAATARPSPSEAFDAPGGVVLTPPFTCDVSSSVIPATTTGVVPLTDVRVGTHLGFDRIVFEFAGSQRPQLTVAMADPPFVGDANGQKVNVAGKEFLSLKLYDASGYPTYTGPDAFSPRYPNLAALVNTGDYEGYVTWIAGLASSRCYRISTLTGPSRIVLDVQAP